jgi:putative addiction module CopG family antidote
MNVSLNEEFESLIKEKVKTGKYRTPAEVIQEGLKLLKERDEPGAAAPAAALEGSAQVRPEKGLERDVKPKRNIADEVKARGRLHFAKGSGR